MGGRDITACRHLRHGVGLVGRASCTPEQLCYRFLLALWQLLQLVRERTALLQQLPGAVALEPSVHLVEGVSHALNWAAYLEPGHPPQGARPALGRWRICSCWGCEGGCLCKRRAGPPCSQHQQARRADPLPALSLTRGPSAGGCPHVGRGVQRSLAAHSLTGGEWCSCSHGNLLHRKPSVGSAAAPAGPAAGREALFERRIAPTVQACALFSCRHSHT